MEDTAKTYALCSSAANGKLIAELKARGARVILFPQIEIVRCARGEKAINLADDLTAFDWLIFTDIFAAGFFLETLEENARDFFELDELRICTLGESVADRLRFAQVHADVVSNSIETSAVIASLAAYVGESEMPGKRFLVVKKYFSPMEIEIGLKEKGALVSKLEIYRAEIRAGAGGENTRLKILLAGGAIDEFIFGAPADFFALEEFTGGALAETLRGSKVSATDRATVQFLRERFVNSALFRRA